MTEVTQTSQPGGNAVLPKRVALEYNALGQRTKISRFESTGTTNAVATTDFTCYGPNCGRIFGRIETVEI